MILACKKKRWIINSSIREKAHEYHSSHPRSSQMLLMCHRMDCNNNTAQEQKRYKRRRMKATFFYFALNEYKMKQKRKTIKGIWKTVAHRLCNLNLSWNQFLIKRKNVVFLFIFLFLFGDFKIHSLSLKDWRAHGLVYRKINKQCAMVWNLHLSPLFLYVYLMLFNFQYCAIFVNCRV